MATEEGNMELETAYIGGGCFWCIEAVYRRIDGIIEAVSGYAGGTVENPTYQQVGSGSTGHAEVVKLVYDPEKISYEEILDIFWHAHDPTTENRQGYDVGTQYRSIILYTDDLQKQAAKASLDKYGEEFKPQSIVTEIKSFTRFYPAETYHQEYYEQNTRAPYCQAVISPKLRKLGLSDITPEK